MDPPMLAAKFESALPYERYVQLGSPDQQRNWSTVYEQAALAAGQGELLGQFTRKMHVLVISGIWCGDCFQQCPLLQRIAEGNRDRIALRLLERDQHKEFSDQFHINGGARVPVVLFLAEDFELCGVFGERTLTRYRALASRYLGAACEIAVTPRALDDLAPVLAEWLYEFERIQLMLRLSPRLRQKHGD